MGAVGAKNSLVDFGAGAVVCSNQFGVDSSADLKALVCSASQGGTFRAIGNEDWSATVQAFGHTPAVKPGQQIATATFVLAGTPGSQIIISGAVYVEGVSITCNQASGDPIAHSIRLSGNGPYAIAANGNIAVPTAVPVPYPSRGCIVELGTVAASPVYTELLRVREWALNLNAPGSAYVDSETAGFNGRTPGNLDWDLSISANWDDTVTPTLANVVKQIRLYVTATTYWDLKWGMSEGPRGFVADRKTGAIVAMSLPWRMHGYEAVGGTPTAGLVHAPGAVSWHP